MDSAYDGKAGRPGERLARALGMAGIVLGAPQIAVPGRFARFIGLDDTRGTRAATRAIGVRELAAAAAILTRSRPLPGIWSRVAGDGMDLALLAVALRSRADRRRVTAAAAAVAGVTALDVLAAVRLSRRTHPSHQATGGGIRVAAGVTVSRSATEAYDFWRDFSRLPTFMTHLESVKASDDGTSHWTANGPAGSTVEWDAVIVEDVPGELLSWRSAEGADVPNSGTVRFGPAPGGRGTEVRVELSYDPPAGALGAVLARLLGEEPNQQVTDDLRRFKQVIETGEVVRSDGTPEGHRAGRQLRQRPGRPQR